MPNDDKTETAPAAGQGRRAGREAPPVEQLLHDYREMLLIRRFEEKAGQLYGMGLIAGFCHLYIGQEAVVVGMQATARQGDSFITTYRDHGHMLACGMEAKGVMAELTGRVMTCVADTPSETSARKNVHSKSATTTTSP